MKEIKYFCDCCGKEIPYTELKTNGKSEKMWHFGKLDFLPNNLFLNQEYEICEKCAGQFNLEFMKSKMQLFIQMEDNNEKIHLRNHTRAS